MNNDTEWDFQEILRRFSLWGGIALALISIYFSYDGLDQTITGGNPSYTEIAKYIGIVMAVMVTLIQFVFNTDFGRLSLTLRVVGAASYFYSMYTNYLGINHLFGFNGITGVMIAVFMDVTPEALISWSLEDVTQGDLLGNLGKMVLGSGKRHSKSKQVFQQNTPRPAPQKHQPNMSDLFSPSDTPKKGIGRHVLEAQRQGKPHDKPNRFDLGG